MFRFICGGLVMYIHWRLWVRNSFAFGMHWNAYLAWTFLHIRWCFTSAACGIGESPDVIQLCRYRCDGYPCNGSPFKKTEYVSTNHSEENHHSPLLWPVQCIIYFLLIPALTCKWLWLHLTKHTEHEGWIWMFQMSYGRKYLVQFIV